MNETRQPRLVSRDVLQAYLDRQPTIHHRILVIEDATGEIKYLETTQVDGEPPIVYHNPADS